MLLYWHIKNNINDLTTLFVNITSSFLQCTAKKSTLLEVNVASMASVSPMEHKGCGISGRN